MARPTFLQKVLRRPSKKYAGTISTTEPTHPAPQEPRASRDFHSTKEELLRIAAELNREGCIDIPCYHQEESCEFIQVSRDKHSPELTSDGYLSGLAQE